MKFYKLKYSLNTKEIGEYPQSVSAKIRGNLSELGQGKELVLPELILQSKAKPTTYISAVTVNGAFYLILKNNFIYFLDHFILGEYKSWNIKIHHKNVVHTDYSLFYLLESGEKKYVNYKNSEFLIGKIGDWKDPSIRKPITISGYENYENILDVLKESNDGSDIRCNKLVLNFSDASEDLFRLANMPYIGTGYYVSEHLKKAIEEQGFTGMSFVEIKEIDKRIEVIY